MINLQPHQLKNMSVPQLKIRLSALDYRLAAMDYKYACEHHQQRILDLTRAKRQTEARIHELKKGDWLGNAWAFIKSLPIMVVWLILGSLMFGVGAVLVGFLLAVVKFVKGF